MIISNSSSVSSKMQEGGERRMKKCRCIIRRTAAAGKRTSFIAFKEQVSRPTTLKIKGGY